MDASLIAYSNQYIRNNWVQLFTTTDALMDMIKDNSEKVTRLGLMLNCSIWPGSATDAWAYRGEGFANQTSAQDYWNSTGVNATFKLSQIECQPVQTTEQRELFDDANSVTQARIWNGMLDELGQTAKQKVYRAIGGRSGATAPARDAHGSLNYYLNGTSSVGGLSPVTYTRHKARANAGPVVLSRNWFKGEQRILRDIEKGAADLALFSSSAGSNMNYETATSWIDMSTFFIKQANDKGAELGYENYTFNGSLLAYSPDLVDNSLYLLTTKYLVLAGDPAPKFKAKEGVPKTTAEVMPATWWTQFIITKLMVQSQTLQLSS